MVVQLKYDHSYSLKVQKIYIILFNGKTMDGLLWLQSINDSPSFQLPLVLVISVVDIIHPTFLKQRRRRIVCYISSISIVKASCYYIPSGNCCLTGIYWKMLPIKLMLHFAEVPCGAMLSLFWITIYFQAGNGQVILQRVFNRISKLHKMLSMWEGEPTNNKAANGLPTSRPLLFPLWLQHYMHFA